jgi:hypothetical protein
MLPRGLLVRGKVKISEKNKHEGPDMTYFTRHLICHRFVGLYAGIRVSGPTDIKYIMRGGAGLPAEVSLAYSVLELGRFTVCWLGYDRNSSEGILGSEIQGTWRNGGTQARDW